MIRPVARADEDTTLFRHRESVFAEAAAGVTSAVPLASAFQAADPNSFGAATNPSPRQIRPVTAGRQMEGLLGPLSKLTAGAFGATCTLGGLVRLPVTASSGHGTPVLLDLTLLHNILH